MTKPKKTHQTGLWAEWIARLYLRCTGYKIIAHRLRTPVGEIDILAKKGDTWVIIEVKYRKTKTDAYHAITPHQQARLIKASLWISQQNNLPQTTPIRFDAILLWGNHNLKHLKNAWQVL